MPAALSPAAGEYGSRRRWSWLDLSVAGAIAAAAAFLLVPAIYQSHLYSQRIQCQDNLQHVGAALANYSDRHDGYYPTTSPHLPLSAATLVSQGYVPDSAVVCPSTPHDGVDEPSPIALPESLKALQWEQLNKLVSKWNSYGYTLGFRDGDRLLPQRNQHRKNFALSSDMPGKSPSDKPSNSPNHGGNGQNVLFEDGHVSYLNSSKTDGGEDIFRNADGEVGPGVDRDDAVIVPNEEPAN